jgi:arabinogalactan oligomer/maltooligosaccharide transport system substrate-binding protein
MKKFSPQLLLLPLLLVACGGVSEPEPTGPFELSVWGPQQEQIFLQAKAIEFKEANPDLEVEFKFTAVGEPELKSFLTVDVAGGADVFAFVDDQLQDLVNAGALSPVQQFRTDVIARNKDWTVEVSKVGETLYAYPNTSDNGIFMYYDKRFLNESELTTLDSILAKAESLDSNVVIDPAGGWQMSMWFAKNGNISWNSDTRFQTIDWNNANGLKSTKGMFNAYATNRVIPNLGLLPTLFLKNETNITEGAIAGISGTWEAKTFTQILGEENIGMIKLPTFTNGDNQQVQLGSMIGAKLIGVNAFTDRPAAAHRFANFLTSAKIQKDRALLLGVGPSNLEAASDQEVLAIPSIKAIFDQSAHGILQAKSVSPIYWDAAGAFANAIISESRGIDVLVENGVVTKITNGDFGVIVDDTPNSEQLALINTFRSQEKTRLLGLSYEGLQDKLDQFITAVLAINEE